MTLHRSPLLILVLCVCVPLIHAQQDVKTLNLTFTTIDVPGAGVTGVYGINSAGDMVGYYGDDPNAVKHGFLLRNGQFTYLDYPGAYTTIAYGINDSGLIVGYAEFQGGLASVGFLYDGVAFTPIQDGNRSATYCTGIDNAGDIVGSAGTVYTTKAFQMRGGHFKAVNFPGEYVYAVANGINNLGVIVGYTDYDAFAYKNGRFRNLDFPGADQTTAWGINDAGVIVGWYAVPQGCLCAFALKNGKYVSFSYPAAAFTGAASINGAGQVVGQYTFDYQTWHGYVTNPISPDDF